MHWSGKLVFCETEKKCSWLVGFGWMVLAAFERVLIDRRSNSEWAQRNDGVEPKQCRWCSCCCCWICVSVVVQLFTTIFHCRLFCLSEIEYVSVVDGLCEFFFCRSKEKIWHNKTRSIQCFNAWWQWVYECTASDDRLC